MLALLCRVRSGEWTHRKGHTARAAAVLFCGTELHGKSWYLARLLKGCGVGPFAPSCSAGCEL